MKSFITWAISIYLFLCGGFYVIQDFFFFHPKQLPANYTFTFNQKFEEKQIALDQKTLIDIVQFKPHDSTPKGVVLYFHGNRKNIERYAAYAQYFTKFGYECWMPDYPGYGKSTGRLTQDAIQNSALELYKMALARYTKDRITIYGKSLGTGPAAYLASVRPCHQLVLETPYYSMSSITKRYLPYLPVESLIKMNFTPATYFKNIAAPITVFHGLQDEVIPFTNAVYLVSSMKKGDRFVAIPGGKHNDLTSKVIYGQVMDSLLGE